MSQEKVDRYKEHKKNRKKIMKREKLERALMKLLGGVVCAAVVVWIGYSAVHMTKTSSTDTTAETTGYVIDTSAIDSYLQSLQTN